METPEQHRARVARHEAVHCVAHICSGLPFNCVDIVSEGEQEGHFHYPVSLHDNLTPERACALAITHKAPLIDALQHQLPTGADVDNRSAEWFLQAVYSGGPWWEIIEARTAVEHKIEDLLKRPEVQAAITALTEALLREETIQEEQAIAIVQAAMQTYQLRTEGPL